MIAQREREIRHRLDYLIPLYEVRKMFGLSWPKLMQIVKAGELPVLSASGERLSLEDVDENTGGLRVLPSELEAYLESMKVK